MKQMQTYCNAEQTGRDTYTPHKYNRDPALNIILHIILKLKKKLFGEKKGEGPKMYCSNTRRLSGLILD